MNDANATWLPNLVGGVSIWKLAVDLNEPKFFDGRLLVPETEGSESLPVTVRWDLTNLIPLNEAREKHPADVEAAVKDFEGALARVAKVFSTPDSGFDKYKTAFTVPAVDADGGANYFYSPEKKKLLLASVIRKVTVKDRKITGMEFTPPFDLLLGQTPRSGSTNTLVTALLDYVVEKRQA